MTDIQKNGFPYGPNNPKRIDLDRVESYTPADFGLTPDAIKTYMFGMRIIDPATQAEPTIDVYNHFIESAISKVEDALDICILPRVIAKEHHDYYETEYNRNVYISLYKKPILQVNAFSMMFNNRQIFNFPPTTWKIYPLPAQIEVYPAGLVGNDFGSTDPQVLYNMSMMPGFFGGNPIDNPLDQYGLNTYAPQAFDLDYVAGFIPPHRQGVTLDFEMPPDLTQLIIKEVLNEMFQLWGRLIIGAGIAGKGLSIDGISQNVNTVQSAEYTGSAADIKLIQADIQNLIGILRAKFAPAFIEV